MRAVTSPLSLRLREDALQRLFFQAQLEGLAPRTLAQRLIEEGLRSEAHPLIAFASGPTGRRAIVRGTGADVWEIVQALQAHCGDIDALVESSGKPREAIDAAIAYYGAFPGEIDERIEANRRAYERGRADYLAGLERITG
jgi:uncharacterized protein (DUF433 family)